MHVMLVRSFHLPAALVLAATFAASGCREAANPPPAPVVVAEEPQQQQPASAPKRAEPGQTTREGALGTSKGFATVDDVLMPTEPFEERYGRDWRKTAVGKRIRVRGTLRIDKCDPRAQCLIQGELPILTPDSIEELGPPNQAP